MPIGQRHRTKIPSISKAAVAAPGAAGGSMLGARYVKQSEDNWCWAACGEMIFPVMGKSSITQCDFASSQFSLVCCPSPGAPKDCDKGCWPDEAYPPRGLATNLKESPMSQTEIRAELAAGRPVQVCYQWSNSNATHVAVIVGEHANGDLEVLDPWYGGGPRSLAQVESGYGQGSWIYSFTF